VKRGWGDVKPRTFFKRLAICRILAGLSGLFWLFVVIYGVAAADNGIEIEHNIRMYGWAALKYGISDLIVSVWPVVLLTLGILFVYMLMLIKAKTDYNRKGYYRDSYKW
jgi:hypothetical protein